METLNKGFSGIMGKQIIIMAALCALLVSGSAQAKKKKHLARVLPSQVKTIHLEKNHHKKVAPAKMKPAEMADELQAEARDNPSASKYFTRSVYYFRSTQPLPDSLNCDEAIEESKKAEAQAEAENKCAANGGEECHVAKVVIAKSGALTCSDFPGGHCPKSGFYRGCVAEALVLGEKRSLDESAISEAAAF